MCNGRGSDGRHLQGVGMRMSGGAPDDLQIEFVVLIMRNGAEKHSAGMQR